MGIPSEIYTPSTYKIVHNTSVDFRSRSVNQPVHLVQYDDTLPIIAVKLYADGSSFIVNPGDNAELELRFGKLDNTFSIIKTLGLDTSKTIAYFEISPQMTLYHGDYYPVLSLTYDKTVAASSPIHFIIDRNPVQNGMIESSNEFTRLLDYVDDAKAYADNAKTFADNANASSGNARTSASVAKESADDANNTLIEVKKEKDAQALAMREAVKNALASGLTNKGTYDSNTQYNILDYVVYEGKAYIATEPTKGNLPTDTNYWTSLGDKISGMTWNDLRGK